jgi:hypothetical protein
VENRWYKAVGYTPEDAPLPPTRGRRRPAKARHSSGLLGYSGKQWLFGTATSVLAASFVWAAIQVRTRLSPPPTYEVLPETHARALLKVERTYRGQAAALELTRRLSPELTGITRRWRDGQGLKRFGNPTGRQAFYAAFRRPEFEDVYSERVLDGIGRPALFEIAPPLSWTAKSFRLNRAYWAIQCRVTVEMIDVWSSFRTNAIGPLVNECRLGGVCLIVSDDCGDAFEDIKR